MESQINTSKVINQEILDIKMFVNEIFAKKGLPKV